jgi:hypothetical protein
MRLRDGHARRLPDTTEAIATVAASPTPSTPSVCLEPARNRLQRNAHVLLSRPFPSSLTPCSGRLRPGRDGSRMLRPAAHGDDGPRLIGCRPGSGPETLSILHRSSARVGCINWSPVQEFSPAPDFRARRKDDGWWPLLSTWNPGGRATESISLVFPRPYALRRFGCLASITSSIFLPRPFLRPRLICPAVGPARCHLPPCWLTPAVSFDR